jgi:uncharacterized protein (TIGR02594 family)
MKKAALTAGAIATELMLVTNPTEARARVSHHWTSNNRQFYAATRQTTRYVRCDDHGCHEQTQSVSTTPSGGVSNAIATLAQSNSLVMLAQSQLGNGAIYGRATLWCGRFMNWTLTHAGYRGTGSDLAKSFLALPHTTPHVGAIAVFSRGGRFGHVGIVSGFDEHGNPIVISGNHGHRVATGVYPRQRVLAYVTPR